MREQEGSRSSDTRLDVPVATAWPTAKGLGAMRSVRVSVGPFAREALRGKNGYAASQLTSRLVRAVRTYLAERDRYRAGWALPAFARSAKVDRKVELRLDVDDQLWSDLEAEAERQNVTVDRLVEHAVLYFAAEIDAGRVTQRIMQDLSEKKE